MAGVVVPRNFRLLEEYDAAIGKEGKSFINGKHSGFIHYGLEDRDDNLMLHHWRASIIGPQDTQLGEFMWELELYIPDSYPQSPPQIKFKAPKVSMPAVNGSGKVELSKLNPHFTWKSSMNIADALKAIRDNICQSSVIKASQGLMYTQY
mmetsp:Transcript_28270/g.43803  ORF Transcript_28270/g.43803 Transcript_28270/m.43803 type:complete len:150 (-) Transcript_28270:112-561(-)|eukprot:CAMPEP_0201508400 /NCGR_PEP_ID=MMETSP0161_2-20130828/1778_1 /ASSEMBLY_ACC=CAM_ASM_000251 /TAXON_ID=180227 /ORGANISM="Neoparamoeba aestuarina, Strain SoJaBio B1-5/56/2" /LENGTH=149 /DNA_ID=CAMNT_0047903053 /DNA_START=111 /DNA_END=560 /DNA_ORIENTATION=-